MTAFWEAERDLAQEFTVRRPRREDLEKLSSLYLKAWTHTYGDWGLDWPEKKILDELFLDRQAPKEWLIVEHGAAMVGLLRHSSCLRKIDKIFVHPSYLRTGAGYSLMREYLWLVATKYSIETLLSVEVFPDLERSLRFFTSFGYRESGVAWTSSTSKREVQILTLRFEPVSSQALSSHSRPVGKMRV